MTKKTPTGISSLIQAGAKHQDILKDKTTANLETIQKENAKEEEEEEETQSNEPIILQAKSSFKRYLKKREKEDEENIRIPSSTHKVLKQLSVASGIPISSIVGNILSSSIEDYNKEIKKIIKDSFA